MKSVINTGVKVIARKDEKSIANVFVYANGLNNLPACACKSKYRQKSYGNYKQSKKRKGLLPLLHL